MGTESVLVFVAAAAVIVAVVAVGMAWRVVSRAGGASGSAGARGTGGADAAAATAVASRAAAEVSAMLERQFAQSRELQRADLARADEAAARLAEQVAQLRAETARSLESVRADNATSLERVRVTSAQSLEAMRITMDERLERTLNERLAKSFARVDERLSQVDRGLGEMQGLAAGVGDLKRVLSNVKTRGIVGEVQLGALLREVLAPAQYAQNVVTVPGSSERVEFAVRVPGEDGRATWLPIDAKFPGDAYEHLRVAQEGGDAAAVEEAWKTLEVRLRAEARDIHDKYLSPGATTTFGIMFLPFEGLYTEVAGRPGLLERLQRESRVTVAGPSTMAALLGSLEMAFQAVAIQQRADEIQRVLAQVKAEFGKYQGELERARRQLSTAAKTLDALIGTRTRAMDRALASITAPEDGDVGESSRAADDGGVASGGAGAADVAGGDVAGAHFAR